MCKPMQLVIELANPICEILRHEGRKNRMQVTGCNAGTIARKYFTEV